MTTTLLHGDCREVLRTLPNCSVDSVVTDPPYELGFMGKSWDASGVAYDVDLWVEVLRVLKPGGHLCAFGGTRTYHRMAVAIEDAGFEIRDSIHWLYGSGFPKSLDVSKAIDKQRHDRDDIYRVTAWVRAARDAAGIGNRDIDEAFGFAGMAGHWTSAKSQPAVPTLEQVPTLLDVLGVALDDVPDDIRRLLWDLNGRKGQPGENWWKREVIGKADTTTLEVAPGEGRDRPQVTLDITAAATDAAKQWDGWGTALKPAHEPIVVARKPLDSTVAANVLEHGTGAINIDGCRVDMGDEYDPTKVQRQQNSSGAIEGAFGASALIGKEIATYKPGGRWPANIVFTHAADCDEACIDGCPVAALDAQSDGASRFFTVTEWSEIDVPFRYVAKPSKKERNAGLDGLPEKTGGEATGRADNSARAGAGRTGGSRNFHPTVKPITLMRWLIRLVTPPNGTVLEPFAGSGTTLMAATLEGFDSIGIELTEDYLPIIEGRVAWAEQQAQQTTYLTAHVQEALPL